MPAGAVPPAGRPVRPRDAGSLILLRRASGGNVLMGRRASRHRFLPDLFAFPGGRVDPGDARVVPLRPLAPDVLAALGLVGNPGRARAIAVAAVRETFEETGLLLGCRNATGTQLDLAGLAYLGRAITPSDSPIRYHARFFVADAAAAQGTLGGSGELLDLAWRPLDEALRLPMADVTEFMLRQVGRWLAGDTRPAPLYAYRRGVPVVHGR